MGRFSAIETALLGGLLASGVAGLLVAEESPTHRRITAELEPLRSAFNAEPDHTRAILLASPT